jgi:peptidoglycan hydrolase-like protein with peptidoglycan-binding domain
MKRMAVLIALCVTAVTGLLVTGSAAQAATPTCNSTVTRYSTIIDAFGDRYIGTLPSYGGSSTCLLRRGNSGSAVRSLQGHLNQCFAAGIAEDGLFGPATEAALKYAQGVVGTTRDGVYGPNTRNGFQNHSRWRGSSINYPSFRCVRFTSL